MAERALYERLSSPSLGHSSERHSTEPEAYVTVWKIDGDKAGGICLLCVERSTKYCNYLRLFLPRTMFFLCTFYDRGSISWAPAWAMGGERDFPAQNVHIWNTNIILHPSNSHPAGLDHVSKTRKFCATKLLLCSSRFAFDTHIWLWPPFLCLKMDNTYAHEICCCAKCREGWDGGWWQKARSMWDGGGKSITENCLFQISLFLVFHVSCLFWPLSLSICTH